MNYKKRCAGIHAHPLWTLKPAAFDRWGRPSEKIYFQNYFHSVLCNVVQETSIRNIKHLGVPLNVYGG